MTELAFKIAEQRERNATVCRENAEHHGHHTQWGQEALREAAAWESAAARARAGDMTPFRPCPHCRGDPDRHHLGQQHRPRRHPVGKAYLDTET